VDQVQPFWIVNAIGLHGSAAALHAIAALPAVRIVEDGHAPIELIAPVAQGQIDTGQLPFAAAEPGLLDVKADFLWNLGFLGKGRLVSNIDTGVDGNHVAYASRWRGKQPESSAAMMPGPNTAVAGPPTSPSQRCRVSR
jgi:hypothetical protein